MRISGIEAIQRLVACVNKDKRNSAGADAINDLLGHRDSNVLTISSFYKSDASLNYFGMLATDAQRSIVSATLARNSDIMTPIARKKASMTRFSSQIS